MKKLITFLSIFLFAFVGIAQNTYYVSTTGDNAKDGLTEANAWETLAYAEANADAGSIIALKKGDIFTGLLALGISHGGTVGNPTVWDGSLWGVGANAIIQSSGNRSAPNSAVVNIWDCRYVTMQNITIDGNDTQCHCLVIGGGSDNVFSSGAVQNNEHHIIIQDCEILDGGDESNYYINTLIQTWHMIFQILLFKEIHMMVPLTI